MLEWFIFNFAAFSIYLMVNVHAAAMHQNGGVREYNKYDDDFIIIITDTNAFLE